MLLLAVTQSKDTLPPGLFQHSGQTKLNDTNMHFLEGDDKMGEKTHGQKELCTLLTYMYAAVTAVPVDAAAVRACGKELKSNVRGCWLRLSLCLLLFRLWYL